jgi:hypothetical protein
MKKIDQAAILDEELRDLKLRFELLGPYFLTKRAIEKLITKLANGQFAGIRRR